MKRTILGLAIFLILGLATSIAIAWVGVFHATPDNKEYTRPVTPKDYAVILHPDVYATQITVFPNDSRLLLDASEAIDLPYWSDAKTYELGEGDRVVETAAGWPLRCVRHNRFLLKNYIAQYAIDVNGGLPIRLPPEGPADDLACLHFLPVRPITLGLMCNTLLYAAIWCAPLLVFALFRRLIAWRRARSQLCPRCRYSLREIPSARCPECGTSLNWRPPLLSRGRLVCFAAIACLIIFIVTATVAWLYTLRPPADLHQAAARGDVEAIRDLLEGGEPVDAPICFTLDSTSRWTITQHPQTTTRGLTPLMFAVMNDQLDAAEALLKAGADPNAIASFEAPLHRACHTGSVEMIRLLARYGADPNLDPSRAGFVPLLNLVRDIGGAPLIDVMAEIGADFGFAARALKRVVIIDDRPAIDKFLHYKTPITIDMLGACLYAGDEELLDHLIAHGGDVHGVDQSGRTLVHLACARAAQSEMLPRVLKLGVDVNAQDYMNTTPLMGAARNGDFTAIELLLDAGADPTLKDRFNNTALDQTTDPDIRAILNTAITQWNAEHGEGVDEDSSSDD